MQHYKPMEYKPTVPEVKDATARTLMWVTLVISVLNMLMIGYVFYVVERAVEIIQQFSQLAGQ